jgi:hypothetical protein
MGPIGMDAVAKEYWEMQRLEIMQQIRQEFLATMADVNATLDH